ncbi:uncharacterized protein LOC116297411, partial [Actinia tenebrosa]|uniref:Uncharacterized protein LOC116297411 n=1 Tax=Actinia tenebrosa TaxID=6105 RepID=A0A6P8I8S4_ACTTE
MASEPNDTQMQVERLTNEIEDMPRDMAIFSLCLKSLFAEGAVGTNAEAAVKFRKLRDDTRNDAMVYLKVVLPICVEFVASISEFFEYYETLDYEEWCDKLEDILEETTACKQLCETITKMHEDILVPLKKRQDQANLVVQELKDLQLEFERKKKELEKSADEKS